MGLTIPLCMCNVHRIECKTEINRGKIRNLYFFHFTEIHGCLPFKGNLSRNSECGKCPVIADMGVRLKKLVDRGRASEPEEL